MWSKPGSTEVFVAAEEEIEADNGKQYLWRPISITDAGVGQFADPADPDPAHSMKWDGYLYRPEDRSAIMNVEGHPYVHADWTTSRTGKGRTQTARARMFMEALMGRELEDSEINDELTAKLLECIAVVIFTASEKTSRGGDTYLKLKIDKAFPYRPKMATTAVAAGAPAAPTVAARPVAARTSSRTSANLPFPEPSNWP